MLRDIFKILWNLLRLPLWTVACCANGSTWKECMFNNYWHSILKIPTRSIWLMLLLKYFLFLFLSNCFINSQNGLLNFPAMIMYTWNLYNLIKKRTLKSLYYVYEGDSYCHRWHAMWQFQEKKISKAELELNWLFLYVSVYFFRKQRNNRPSIGLKATCRDSKMIYTGSSVFIFKNVPICLWTPLHS